MSVWWLWVACSGQDAGYRDMWKLELEVDAVRDALIQGDLARTRSRAGQLLEEVPAGPLREALSEVRAATDLQQAGQALGQVASACAECHLASGVVIQRTPRGTVPPPGPLGAEMARHDKVVDGLWLGLIRPSEEALRQALAELPDQSLEPGAEVAWHTAALDQQTHERVQQLVLAERSERYALMGELLAACADCHLAGAAPPSPRLGAVPLRGLELEMREHSRHAAEVQRALVAGDLAAVQREAGALQLSLRESAVPPKARAPLREALAEAERAAQATTLADAAQATATLFLACGQCHQDSGGGPRRALPPLPAAAPHAALYGFGISWMGYGLLAPDERAWTLGAEALAQRQPPQDGLSVDLLRLEASLHPVAQRAQRVTEPQARAELWAELLSSCGPCHQQLR
jgi:mono/diheme cytochrome c family protein